MVSMHSSVSLRNNQRKCQSTECTVLLVFRTIQHQQLDYYIALKGCKLYLGPKYVNVVGDGDQAFLVDISHIWNDRPQHVTSAHSLPLHV